MTSSDGTRTSALAVRLHGTRIGVITRTARDRYGFAFDRRHGDDRQRPTLSLSFKSTSGDLIEDARPTSTRLAPFFSNLLPEGHLRAYLAKRAGVNPHREFLLLEALGADLPGALTVAPAEGDEWHAASSDADVRQRDRIAASALQFSLAGVQLKFSAVREARGGLTIPAHGTGGSWIIKLPSTQFAAVPENEFAMLRLAQAVGIAVPELQLVAIDQIAGIPEGTGRLEGRALAVKRFDRGPDGALIHMEDFAQVFGLYPEDKYEKRSYANIAAVLRAEAGEADTYEFVRRLAFSVLIGNADMHLKNWSLLYPDRIKPALSPAYDLVSTIPYISDDRLALTFGGSRTLTEIATEQVRRFADTARLAANPVAGIIRETAGRVVDAWDRLAERDLLPRAMQEAIGSQIHTVAANTMR